jgi:hypothetical protein
LGTSESPPESWAKATTAKNKAHTTSRDKRETVMKVLSPVWLQLIVKPEYNILRHIG